MFATLDMGHRFERSREDFWKWLAWILPHELVRWTAVRLMVHGTQGKWGNEETPALLAIDALKRWDEVG